MSLFDEVPEDGKPFELWERDSAGVETRRATFAARSALVRAWKECLKGDKLISAKVWRNGVRESITGSIAEDADGGWQAYQPQTSQQILDLAAGIKNRRIFTDQQIAKEHQHLKGRIFPSIAAEGLMRLHWMQSRNIRAVYGKIEEAAPRQQIQGYPIFPIAHFLNEADVEKLASAFAALKG